MTRARSQSFCVMYSIVPRHPGLLNNGPLWHCLVTYQHGLQVRRLQINRALRLLQSRLCHPTRREFLYTTTAGLAASSKAPRGRTQVSSTHLWPARTLAMVPAAPQGLMPPLHMQSQAIMTDSAGLSPEALQAAVAALVPSLTGTHSSKSLCVLHVNLNLYVDLQCLHGGLCVCCRREIKGSGRQDCHDWRLPRVHRSPLLRLILCAEGLTSLF